MSNNQRDQRKRPRVAESTSEQNHPSREKLKQLEPIDINKTIGELVELFLKENLSLNIADLLENVEIVKREFEAKNETFNSRTLKKHILIAAEQMYEKIAMEVQGKFPSLMFNSASRHGRNVFSLSLHFANGEQLVERTIGFITQNQQQTARQLFDQIEQLLSRVGLSCNDVYSTCTDLGVNNLRAAALKKEAQAAIKLCRGIANQSDSEAERTTEDINRVMEEELADEYEDLQMLLEEQEVDREADEQQRQGVEQDAQEEVTVTDVVVEEGQQCTKMFCSAHICQLVAQEVIKEFEAVIAEVRAVVKLSNSLEFTELLHDAGIQKLLPNIKEKWESLLQMMNNVDRFRNQLEEIAVNQERLKLSENAWAFVAEFVRVFTPLHLAMKDFQQEDITISDFYVRWEKMVLQITKVPDGQNQLKTKLREAFEQQKQKFFECDAFIAALLLDPRINWSQNPDDFFGSTLYERGMLQLEKVHRIIENQEDQQDDEEEELKQLLGWERRQTIRQRVDRFLEEPRLLPSAPSPLKYWYNKREEEPEIYRISQVVYGAAFSKIKIKKDFNGFALVLPILKTLLGDETLNDILVCKSNLDLLSKVKFV